MEHAQNAMIDAFPAASEHAAEIVAGVVPLFAAAYDSVAIRALRSRYWSSVAYNDVVYDPLMRGVVSMAHRR